MRREEKVRLLAEGLLMGARATIAKKPDIRGVTVNRSDLKDLIIGSLEIVDNHTVNNWIRLLVVKGFISENTVHRNPSRCDYLINLGECEKWLK